MKSDAAFTFEPDNAGRFNAIEHGKIVASFTEQELRGWLFNALRNDVAINHNGCMTTARTVRITVEMVAE